MKTTQTSQSNIMVLYLLASACVGLSSENLTQNTAPPAQAPVLKTVATLQLSLEPLPREGDGPARLAARGPGYSPSNRPADAQLMLRRSSPPATCASSAQ